MFIQVNVKSLHCESGIPMMETSRMITYFCSKLAVVVVIAPLVEKKCSVIHMSHVYALCRALYEVKKVNVHKSAADMTSGTAIPLSALACVRA